MAEAKAGRELIKQLEAKKSALELSLSLETQNSNSLGISYDKAKNEINELSRMIKTYERAVALLEVQAAKLETENKRLSKKVKKQTLEIWAGRAALTALFVIRFL